MRIDATKRGFDVAVFAVVDDDEVVVGVGRVVVVVDDSGVARLMTIFI